MTSVVSQAVRGAGSSSRPSRLLLSLLASVALLAGRGSPVLAQTLPSGPAVAAGAASISTPSGTSLIVEQSSPNAVINWQSFSIGAGNTVHVNNGSGATLNRVTGNVPSRLDGSLTATGSVYLINPAGVAVGPGGRVATGGSFVASTLDVRDAEFLAGGDKTFSGSSKATVTNAGAIGSLGGDVALIARAAENTGTITAPKGTAALAAGYEVLARDGAVNGGKFQVRIGGADTEAKTTGTITAAVAELRANGGNVYALAGNTGGVIAATGTAAGGGRIYLTAGDDGAVEAGGTITATRTVGGGATQGGDIRVSGGRATVTGTLTAKGSAPPKPGVKPVPGAGGTVVVTGRSVTVAGTATVDASGSSGGTVLIGGDWQGGKDARTKTLTETVVNAAATIVAAGARLSADGSAGDGGSVVVWSDERTEFAGAISARGDGVGADGSAGNGGRAEVSGKAVLSFQGTADLRAGSGRTGSLLLDPYDLTISNGTDSGVSGFSAAGNDSVLNAGTLTAALATANVTVSTGSGGSQEGNITVAAPVPWSANTTLTLQAAGNIAVNAAVTATGSSAGLVLEHGAGKDYSVTAPITLSGSDATLQIGPTGDLASYTLLHDMSAFAQLNSNPVGSYALAQSLNADGTTYTDSPVNSAFFGTFAGLGNTISNLTIDAPSADGIGLFANAGAGSVIRDLTLTGSVTGKAYTGGLAGFGDGLVNNVNTAVTATGTNYVGGLIGQMSRGSVIDSSAAGAVNGASYLGGLIGNLTVDAVTVTRTHATGTVTSIASGVQSYIGGLVGYNDGTPILSSYATGDVRKTSGTSSYSGGLVGINIGTIRDSYATGSVTNSSTAGGLVGYNEGSISNAYATGQVGNADADTVGGLIGQNSGTLSKVYATGSVTGTSKVGGLIGNNDGAAVTQAYATGAVTGGNTDVGGLIGLSWGAVTASYWDTETTGQASSAGGDGVVGLTTAQARDKSNYAGWNFATDWYQEDDLRPIGRWEASADGTITNAHQLQLVAAAPSGTYRLSRDIDAGATAGSSNAGIWSSSGFVPIGSGGTPFSGTFDGGGHTISNLTINRSSTDGVGLFSEAGAASVIRDLTLTGTMTGGAYTGGLAGRGSGLIKTVNTAVTVTGTDHVGGLVGEMAGGSVIDSSAANEVNGEGYIGGLIGRVDGTTTTLTRVHADGTVTNISQGGARAFNGGLVGYNNGGTIESSYATGEVRTASGTANYSGGLVGENTGTIRDSYATGNVPGSWDAGGLVGRNWADISNSYATGSVGGDGMNSVGGLIGDHFTGTLSNVYATGSVNGTGPAGGLIGFMEAGSLADAFASGDVSSTFSSVGGLIGQMASGSVTRAYATGSVNGTNYVGGLIGFNSGTVSQVYATGTVNGAVYVGGLIGANGGAVSQAYAIGAVSGSDSDIGGLIGSSNGTVTASYWDKDSTGQASSAGGSGAVGLTTAQMAEDWRLFEGWDWTVWALPVLGSLRPELYGVSGVVGGIRSITYGDDPAGATVSVVGDGWWNSVTGTLSVGSLTATDAGAYDLAVSGASGTTRTGNATRFAGAGIVNKATLTVTAGNSSMTYGDTPPAGITYTATGWKNGQTGSLLTGVTTATTATATSNAGSYATSASGGTLGGAATGNYTLSYVNGTMTVNAATLTVTAADSSMTYGDTPPADIGYTATGWKNGQTSSLLTGVTTATTATATSDAGSYATSASGGTLSGAATGNYTLSYVGGAMTVTPATLTVTAADSSMTYGDTPPTGITYTASGWKNGQTDSLLSGVTTTTAATATSNVGSYATSASGGSLSGAATGNYSLSYVNGTMTVTPATLTVTAADSSMTYGGSVPAIGYGTAGWKNGQDATLLTGVTTATTATATSNVGSYATSASGGTLGGAATGNYTVNYVNGALSVTARPITVSADSKSRVYGNADPALTYSVGGDGLVNGDTLSGALAAAATSTSGVGSYGIGQGTLAASSNYSLTFNPGTLSITARPVTVTADDQSRVYGNANPALTYSIGGDGLVNGDTLSGALAAAATSTSGVGSYGIGQGTLAASSNYSLTFNPGTLSITARPVTVTADDQSRVYGNANPALTYRVGGDGLANGDTLSGALATAAGAASPAGSYGIGQGTLAASSNYSLVFTPGTLSVTTRPITVTADDQSRAAGTANPALTYSIGGDGLVNGDTLSGALATAAGAASPAGSYSITQGTLAASSNYALAYGAGVLTVQQAGSGSGGPPANAPPQEVTRQVIAATLPRNMVETTVHETGAAFFGGEPILSGGTSTPTAGTASAAASTTPGADTQSGSGTGTQEDGGEAGCTGGAAGAGCASQPHPANTHVGRFLRFSQQPRQGQ